MEKSIVGAPKQVWRHMFYSGGHRKNRQISENFRNLIIRR